VVYLSFYEELAKYYDLMYSNKNYSDEVESIHEIISQYKTSTDSKLLDMACGTGGHVEYFKKYYDVTGCDLNQDMLNVAKQKHPEITFIQSDMITLDIKQRFDIITCLFGSISHLPDTKSLHSAVSVFANHLVPGGIVIIEPFLFWEDVLPNHVSMVTVDEPKIKLARISTPTRDGDYLLLDFHFIIGNPGNVRYYHDPHKMFLYSKEMFETTITTVGLEYHYVKPEWARSGLVIGRKS
jgi:SAM-dependent methyltransferase